jgi:hypothetical protein
MTAELAARVGGLAECVGIWIPGLQQSLQQLAPGTWDQALAGLLDGRPGRPDDGPSHSVVEIA